MDDVKKTIALLGSTGSIGVQSLDVCRGRGYKIAALAANSNVKLLAAQAREFRPERIAVAETSAYSDIKLALADMDVKISAGPEAVCEIAAMDGADTVIDAVVGIAGLRPALAALNAGHSLALANKEALITGGSLVMAASKEKNAPILPVDSEHSAIWQCLQGASRADLSKIILTASGGPFFGKTKDELANITAAEALRHPNWSMGAKITVDSATLMNKGLEFMEAMWLFGLSPAQIEVVVHRQSVVHSAVEYADGSVIAQLGVPDMRCAIQFALTYPRHLPLEGKRLSLTDYGSLTFEKPDYAVFDCLSACLKAAKTGGLAPTVANGANEQAVKLFLDGKIGFLQIGESVMSALENVKPNGIVSLEAIEDADRAAREHVMKII